MSKSILYVSYDGLTDALGQSQVLSYLSALTRPDRRIVIISYEKTANYEKNVQIVQKIVTDAGLHWEPLWYHKQPPILSTVLDLRRGMALAEKLHTKYNFDLVHCRSHLSCIIGMHLEKKLSIPFVFDMRAWWADEKLDSGNWNQFYYKPIYTFFKRHEGLVFKKAAYIVSLTHAGAKEIQNLGLTNTCEIGVIPTCVNLSVFKPFNPALRQKMRQELRIDTKSKVLVYSGSIGGNYDVNIMKAVFAAFLKLYPNGHILILSKDTVSENFTSQLSAAEIKSYTIRNVPYRKVSDFLQAGDLGFIFYKPAYSNIGRSPTKLAEYWATGIPVISFKNIGDLDFLFKQYPLGGALCKEDLSDLNECIAAVDFGHQETLREYACDYFGLDRGVAFYDNMYNNLLQADNQVNT